jgi:hypothetical protein
VGRHYKQTHRARLLRLIRLKVRFAEPDLDLNRLTICHHGYKHSLASLLVQVERLGMRKLVSILIELDRARGQADKRKQTWVTRMIEAAAAAHLDPKDIGALLDRKGIAPFDNLMPSASRGPFSNLAHVAESGNFCKRVVDDAGPDRWKFLCYIHPGQFAIAYHLIRQLASSRKVSSIETAHAFAHRARDVSDVVY